ncbi:MAG: hypothetical protein MR890_03880 [Akkermansia muciniphila]|nr:hypothetical protein [Akkermansia muciniphila]
MRIIKKDFQGVDMSSAGAFGLRRMIAEGACPSLSLSHFSQNGRKTDCQHTPLFFHFGQGEIIQIYSN